MHEAGLLNAFAKLFGDFILGITPDRAAAAVATGLAVGMAMAALVQQLIVLPAAADTAVENGRQIYMEGVTAAGPVAGNGAAGQSLAGRAAACVNCHRQSGFGMFEGTRLVPPVTGPALFENKQPLRSLHRSNPGSTFEDHPFLTRPPYDETSLARAIREGVSTSGHVLSDLMPRYTLDDEAMRSLIAFLRQLSATRSPGADLSDAHFATIVTPGQPDERRRQMVDLLSACLDERFPARRQRGWRWHLHVWDLSGPPETWPEQLDAAYHRQPVFAVIAGLGSDWSAVHDYCEARALPCLYPHADVPGGGTRQDRHVFYFSGGVILEAAVASRYVAVQSARRGIDRVILLSRADGAGASATAEARRKLEAGGARIEERHISGNGATDLRAALSGLGATDALLMWLDGADVERLAGIEPPKAGLILLSGWMAGGERAPLASEWRRAVEMVYPFDAPGRREARMSLNLGPWLARYRALPGDTVLQASTLSACNLVTESMARMRGFLFREYLIDTVETYPTGPGMGNAAAALPFPRFATGIGQRFASRGAYIARFKADDAATLELVEDWITP